MRILPLLLLFSLSPVLRASEFKHVGDFLLQAHFKLTGQQVTPIPMKPIAFRVFTDGVKIRVTAEGDENSASYGPTGKGRSDEGTRIRKPGLDEMGPGTDREVPLNFRERPAARSTQGLAGQKPKYKGGGGKRR